MVMAEVRSVTWQMPANENIFLLYDSHYPRRPSYFYDVDWSIQHAQVRGHCQLSSGSDTSSGSFLQPSNGKRRLSWSVIHIVCFVACAVCPAGGGQKKILSPALNAFADRLICWHLIARVVSLSSWIWKFFPLAFHRQNHSSWAVGGQYFNADLYKVMSSAQMTIFHAAEF
jgi:hypothetical protein